MEKKGPHPGHIRKGLLVTTILTSMTVLSSNSYTDDTQPSSIREYKTKSGKTIIISETHPVGQSLSSITISTKDFEHNYPETYENLDPISEVFVADLDGNGFDEIYIVTTSQGSGSYGNIIGFASNKDKSISMIHFPEIEKEDERFQGYMGHDIFMIEDQKLVRIFPFYNENDTNQNPTGGKRKLIYGLYSGEAMWQLKIEKSETMNQSIQ